MRVFIRAYLRGVESSSMTFDLDPETKIDEDKVLDLAIEHKAGLYGFFPGQSPVRLSLCIDGLRTWQGWYPKVLEFDI